MKHSGIRILTTIGLFIFGYFPIDAADPDSLRVTKTAIDTAQHAKNKALVISGYFQGQFQYGEPNATLKVGAPNSDPGKNFNRIGIRRGRLKFSYSKKISKAVFQIDLTEKGIGIKDAYLQLASPKIGESSITLGVFNRPFGNEIQYSSSNRESPERSKITTTLFPEERDLGVMLTLQANKTSFWKFLKIDAGLFSGNGVKSDIKNKKDFIGHLYFFKNLQRRISFQTGVSYYYGGVYQGSSNIYHASNNTFILSSDSSNIGKYARREYFGLDIQIKLKSSIGQTSLSAELIRGTQPGEKNSSSSPNSKNISTNDLYIRKFIGGYVSLVQDIGKFPLSILVKYDLYDPNIQFSRDNIGLGNSSKGDVAFQNFGFGIVYKMNKDIKITLFQNIVKNELTNNLAEYNQDLHDNYFTMRLQYKF